MALIHHTGRILFRIENIIPNYNLIRVVYNDSFHYIFVIMKSKKSPCHKPFHYFFVDWTKRIFNACLNRLFVEDQPSSCFSNIDISSSWIQPGLLHEESFASPVLFKSNYMSPNRKHYKKRDYGFPFVLDSFFLIYRLVLPV